MKIIELVIDEDQEMAVEAISIVEKPAIEEDFIAFKNRTITAKSAKFVKKLLNILIFVNTNPRIISSPIIPSSKKISKMMLCG